jgi:hypothetical protein
LIGATSIARLRLTRLQPFDVAAAPASPTPRRAHCLHIPCCPRPQAVPSDSILSTIIRQSINCGVGPIDRSCGGVGQNGGGCSSGGYLHRGGVQRALVRLDQRQEVLHYRFRRVEAINPNVIPHPSLADTWIIVAQKQRSDLENSVFFSELVSVTPSSRMAPLPALILRYSCL